MAERNRESEDGAVRVAVAGGTGLVGRMVTRALRGAGHEPVVLARDEGVDVVSGDGLDAALAGVDAIVDVLNTAATEADAARAFFGAAAGNLLAAGERAGARHYVLLSIVGIDRVEENGYYAGKRRQEEVVANGPLPWSILPATQFFEFAEMVVGRTLADGAATLPPLLIQPVAAADVATALAELAVGPAVGRAPAFAGPDPQDLVDMARRTLAARGDTGTRLIPSWQGGHFGPEMAGEVLLPGPDARLAPTTFDDWLAALR